MVVLNDDGVALDLNIVLILFLTPNILLILLTALCTYCVYASKKHTRLLNFLGAGANLFSRGAFVSIVASILQQLEKEKHRNVEQSTSEITPPSPSRLDEETLYSQMSHPGCPRRSSLSKKKQDADYLLLIPIQIDLLLTVFFYKILTRRIYFETCRTYLTTYDNRPKQIVCWRKYTNNNVSNSNVHLSLHDYCVNQTISYINYEYNDVNCIQYAFKLINIIDTTTNVLAWHQATVFIVTKSIVCAYWWQRKMRKTSLWLRLVRYQRRVILAILVYPLMTLYVVIFVFIIPVYFVLMEQRRIDLTHYLLYACIKFVIASIAHINRYTLSKWDPLYQRNDLVLTEDEEQEVGYQQHLRFPAHHDNTTRLISSNSLVLNDHPACATSTNPSDT